MVRDTGTPCVRFLYSVCAFVYTCVCVCRYGYLYKYCVRTPVYPGVPASRVETTALDTTGSRATGDESRSGHKGPDTDPFVPIRPYSLCRPEPPTLEGVETSHLFPVHTVRLDRDHGRDGDGSATGIYPPEPVHRTRGPTRRKEVDVSDSLCPENPNHSPCVLGGPEPCVDHESFTND